MKVEVGASDNYSMLFLLALITAGYFAGLVWLRRARRRQAPMAAALPLADEDQPPSSAVGWPPEGERLSAYLDEGFAALDAYLSEGYAA